MNVEAISVDKDLAKQKYKEYIEAAKKQKSKEYSALRRAYRALSKGLKVIDIYQAFNDTGKKSDKPKLAIVRADSTEVFFTKQSNGAGKFSRHDPRNWRNHEIRSDVALPSETFEPWVGENPERPWVIPNSELVTNVPIIPASVSVPKKLENYYILFEVKEWRNNATVRDPYLLERINDNTFVVLAEWDVTDVEAIVMRSRAVDA